MIFCSYKGVRRNSWCKWDGRGWKFSLKDLDSAHLNYFAILKSSFPSSRDFYMERIKFLFQFLWDTKILKLRGGSVKTAIITKDVIAQCWQRCGVGGTLIYHWWESKIFGRHLACVLKVLSICVLCLQNSGQNFYDPMETIKDVCKDFPVGLSKLCL